MKEFINEAIFASGNDTLRESYDKEWALKDQSMRDGMEIGREQGMKQGREQGIAQGIEQGIAQGIEQGIEKGIEFQALKTARKMLEKYPDMDYADVANISGLSLEDLKKLSLK